MCPKCGKNLKDVGRRIEATLVECVVVSDSSRNKTKDQRGKVVIESKIESETEKRYSRKPSRALQLVFEEGKIVHIHCKSADCGNEWKMGGEASLDQKFGITQNQQGIREITCKKCGRRYEAG
jgi:hypothetical protein